MKNPSSRLSTDNTLKTIWKNPLNNLQRITLACFLAYFVMSGMMTPIGVITGAMADYFHRPVTEITANFSWLTGGIFIGAILALFVYEWASLKYVLLTVYSLTFISLLSLILQTDLTSVWLALGLVGACCGVGLAGAAATIARSYELERRASMLIITDGCFSIAGFVCAWIAIQLIAHDIHWAGTYMFIAVISGVIIFLIVSSSFPENRPEKSQGQKSKEPWPTAAWICVFILIVYSCSQNTLLLWLPNYAETQLGAPRNQAGKIISQFWLGMFGAQLFVCWWVLKVGVQRVVILGSIANAIATIPLLICTGIEHLNMFSLLFGLVNLGFLKATLSMATQMVRVPPARLVSMLLLGATTGTAIAPWVSSQIVEVTDNHTVLIFGSIGYFFVAAMVIIAIKLSPVQLTQHPNEK